MVTIKNNKLILVGNVPITGTMMDILQAECPCDLSIDEETNCIKLEKEILEGENIEDSVKQLKNILADVEGTMLAKEAEEVKTENIEQKINELLDKAVKQKIFVAVITVDEHASHYRGNMPPIMAMCEAMRHDAQSKE